MAKTPADDDRFAQLIQDEYGQSVTGPGVAEDAVHKAAKKQARRSTRPPEAKPPQRTWFSLDDAIDKAEPEYEPWEQFTPPAPAPLARPRNRLAIFGVLALVAAFVIAILWLVGVPTPLWLRGVGGLAVGAGLLLLLLSLPRRRARDDFDDGAVV